MNADCKDIPTLLVRQADGDLDSEQEARLEAHLFSCVPCRDQRARFLLVDRELAEYGELSARERSLSAEQRRPRFRLSAAFAFAVAVMAAAVIWVPWMGRSPASKPLLSAAPGQTAESPFVPIPYVPMLAPYESARVVHMEVSVAALIAAGYHVPLTDPASIVPADVLVSEDGRIRAVRLLGDETQNGKGLSHE